MESKKINQLATEMSPASSDLTIIGDPITGVSKKVTLEQISSLFASSISFYTNYASFPATGSIDTLYCAKDTNKLYIWSGSAYVETFPSQALLDTYQLRSEKGNANGYASLDGSGKVPSTQLPSYVDDIIEVANYASLPVTGETGKIYITLDNNKIYRWSGSVYVEIASNNAIWGSITGTLSNQTDLQNALNAKVPTTRTLTIDGTAYDLSADRTWNILPTGGADGQILAKASATNYDTEWIDNYTSTVKHYVKLSENMTIGTAAYIDDASGTNMIAAKASYDAESTSAQTMGLIGQTGITNDIVFLITEGLLSGVNTSTATIGDPVYLGLNGALIFGVANKPSAPNNLVYLGVVTRVSSTVGEIFVKVQNGYELQELHNVAISSVANNQGLFYESSTSLWKNKSIATVLGYTPISLTSLSATTPLSYNNTTGAFSISQASGSADGYLSSTDWTTFNNKQDALTNPITGTGVSGRIAYFNGTTTQTSSANLTWDATNNRVGIGLTNPQRSLEIYSATADSHLRLSGAAPSVSMGEAITGAVYQAKFGLVTSNGQFVTGGLAGDFVIISQTGATIWATSGGEKMRLTSGGNLGIGTTSPTFTLQVSGTTRISGQLSLGSTITNGTFTYTLPGATGTLALTSDLSSYLPLSGGTLTGALSGTSATFSGNVGVGSTSAGANVNIYSSSYGSNGVFQAFGTDGALKLQMGGLGTNQAYLYTGSGNKMTFFSGGNTALELASTGAATFSSSVTASTNFIAQSSTTNSLRFLYENTYNKGGVSIDYTTGELKIYTGESSNGYFQTFHTNGSEKLRISSTGNVGIGTDAPGAKLDVNGGDLYVRTGGGIYANTLGPYSGNMTIALGGSGNSLIVSGGAATFSSSVTAASDYINGTIADNGTGRFRGSFASVNTSSSLAKVQFGGGEGSQFRAYMEVRQVWNGSGTDQDVAFTTFKGGVGSAESMIIKGNGNVGIGTTSPTTVTNYIVQTINGTSGSFTEYQQGGSYAFRIGSDSSLGGFLNQTDANPIRFFINSGERMRITSTGDVCINATTSGGYKFYANGSAAFGSVFVGSLGTGTVYSSSGTLTNTNPSDKRLKDNITPITYGLNEVLQLNPVSFDWKNDNNKNKQFGFIAQEVQKVMPEAVIEGEYLGLEKDAIYTALVNAIKELEARLKTLENK